MIGPPCSNAELQLEVGSPVAVFWNLLPRCRRHDTPDAASFAHGISLASADSGDFFDNLDGQLLDGVQKFNIAAYPVSGERSKTERKLGCFLRELFHYRLP
jgi:hypothetical protein